MTLHVHKDLMDCLMTLQWIRTLVHVTKSDRTFLESGQISDISTLSQHPLPVGPPLVFVGLKSRCIVAGLGFCHGKNYFCLDCGKKPVKTVAKTAAKTGKIKDTIN